MTTQAKPETQTIWEFDKAHTRIGFAARNMMVSTVKGRFTKFEGQIVGSPDDPTNSRVEVTIDASSIDTGNERRDEHLRSADFLDVEAYPTITYKSTAVEQTDENAFRVKGDLTIHGITKEVELKASIDYLGSTVDGQEVVDLPVTGELSRKAWGVRWNVVLETGGVLIGDAVRIEIFVEAATHAHTVATR